MARQPFASRHTSILVMQAGTAAVLQSFQGAGAAKVNLQQSTMEMDMLVMRYLAVSTGRGGGGVARLSGRRRGGGRTGPARQPGRSCEPGRGNGTPVP